METCRPRIVHSRTTTTRQVREVEVAGPRFWRQRVPAGPALAALYRSGALFVQRRAGAPGAAAGPPLGGAADVQDLLPHAPLQVPIAQGSRLEIGAAVHAWLLLRSGHWAQTSR